MTVGSSHSSDLGPLMLDPWPLEDHNSIAPSVQVNLSISIGSSIHDQTKGPVASFKGKGPLDLLCPRTCIRRMRQLSTNIIHKYNMSDVAPHHRPTESVSLFSLLSLPSI